MRRLRLSNPGIGQSGHRFVEVGGSTCDRDDPAGFVNKLRRAKLMATDLAPKARTSDERTTPLARSIPATELLSPINVPNLNHASNARKKSVFEMETRLARVKAGLGPRVADLTDRTAWDWYAQSCLCGLPPGDCRVHPRDRHNQRPPLGDWQVRGMWPGARRPRHGPAPAGSRHDRRAPRRGPRRFPRRLEVAAQRPPGPSSRILG
jgi:hypothetical protein